MESLYINLKKEAIAIESDHKRITNPSYNENNWNQERKAINLKIKSFQTKYESLKEKVEYVKNNSLDSSYQNKLEIYDELLNNKIKKNTLPAINAIKYKVSEYSSVEMRPTQEEDEKKSQQQEIVYDLMNNKEVLEQRRKELNEINVIAAQLKDTTDIMVQEVEKQGAQLDEIETNVITSKENAEKAKQEIIKADQMSKGNNKRMCCLIFIIFIAIGGISAIIISLIFGLKK
jgi:hypothetical protein